MSTTRTGGVEPCGLSHVGAGDWRDCQSPACVAQRRRDADSGAVRLNSRLKVRTLRGRARRSLLQSGEMLCVEALDADGRRYLVEFTPSEIVHLAGTLSAVQQQPWFARLLSAEAFRSCRTEVPTTEAVR